jgi:hypothetical protein
VNPALVPPGVFLRELPDPWLPARASASRRAAGAAARARRVQAFLVPLQRAAAARFELHGHAELWVLAADDWARVTRAPYGWPFTRTRQTPASAAGAAGPTTAIVVAAEVPGRLLQRFEPVLLAAGRAGVAAPRGVRRREGGRADGRRRGGRIRDPRGGPARARRRPRAVRPGRRPRVGSRAGDRRRPAHAGEVARRARGHDGVPGGPRRTRRGRDAPPLPRLGRGAGGRRGRGRRGRAAAPRTPRAERRRRSCAEARTPTPRPRRLRVSSWAPAAAGAGVVPGRVRAARGGAGGRGRLGLPRAAGGGAAGGRRRPRPRRAWPRRPRRGRAGADRGEPSFRDWFRTFGGAG